MLRKKFMRHGKAYREPERRLESLGMLNWLL